MSGMMARLYTVWRGLSNRIKCKGAKRQRGDQAHQTGKSAIQQVENLRHIFVPTLMMEIFTIRLRGNHWTLAGEKWEFSMMPKVLPNGSATAATRMPSPTSCRGSRIVAPNDSRRFRAAAASGTPQYATVPPGPGVPLGSKPSSKPPTEYPT